MATANEQIINRTTQRKPSYKQIVLAATLSPIGMIPVAGVVPVSGIDKLMSECRALTNVCGNSVASIFVEGEPVPARA